MLSFRDLIILLVLFLQIAAPVLAENKNDSLKNTIALLRNALLKKDMQVLLKHIDFNGIIKAKVKGYAFRAQKKGFMLKAAGKIVSLGEPVINIAASKYILNEFSRSSLTLRKSYLSSLSINKCWDNGQAGVVTGTFMGELAILQALKINGKWVVVSVNSPLIDREFRDLLKMLHVLL